MRTFKLRGALLSGLVLAGCSLLAACGLTSVSGTAGGASSTPETTVIPAGTQGTVQPITASPTSTQPATAHFGGVRLVLDKTSYKRGGSATVTIENGLSKKIEVSDHHTDCTFVQLEHLTAGTWKPVGLCKLMTPTRLVDLAPGSVTPQKIGIPADSGAAGTYRVALTYNGTTAYSATFNVA